MVLLVIGAALAFAGMVDGMTTAVVVGGVLALVGFTLDTM